MIPHFNRLLERAPSATYMLVRSGTSRIVILDGTHIRAGRAGHTDVLRIMLGHDGHGGLGGLTLQDNKVALVWPEPSAGRFRFRFLQVIPSQRAVLPMECSNSASAAAVLAQLGGHHRGLGTHFEAVNLSTRQRIELHPNRDDAIADAWTIRFLAGRRVQRPLYGPDAGHQVRLDGRRVSFVPVLQGNLFLFSDLSPAECDAKAAAVIARAGLRVARDLGFRAAPGYAPKVIPYRPGKAGRRTEVHAASIYHGERHRSMPGSAAMALCGFMAMQPGGQYSGQALWRIRHPGGSMDVTLGIEDGRNGPRVAWSEFTTPVSLLAWGAAAMPWRRNR